MSGLENFKEAITKYEFIKAVGWTVFITVGGVVLILVCCSMCAWFITRVQTKITKAIYLLCVFSMYSIPDGNVYLIRNGRFTWT